MSDNLALGPGKEFDTVRGLLEIWGDAATGVGDDAAVLELPRGARLVVSVDSSVENVHFRRDWLPSRAIGWRAAAAALSDLAAMAASPLGVLVSLSVPSEWREELDEVARGIGEAVVSAGARIVGGDLTAARELAISITVLGHSHEPLTRGGARAGDLLYLTGELGGPRSAVMALERGEEPTPAARERFEHPAPRLREAIWLAAHGAHAAIDISDGLAGDAAHLAAASGVSIELLLDAIPTINGGPVRQAVASGEEYELLVAVPPLALSQAIDPTAFEREFGVRLSVIGRVEQGTPGVRALLAGERVALTGGFDHFS